MSYCVELQNVCQAVQLPKQVDFEKWVGLALSGRCKNTEITIRLVDAEESAALNQQYRKKSSATNVLSFPFITGHELPQELSTLNYLGDLVICPEVIIKEAKEQGKTSLSHWAHIVIHGCLHLLGYDHVQQEEAMIMENIEIQIMQELGYANPYEETVSHE